MKIEAGKYYKTRDGRKAFVALQVPVNPFTGKQDTDRCWGGWTSDDSTPTAWGDDGTSPRYPRSDLISVWVEPPTPLEVCKELVNLCGTWDLMKPFADVRDKARAAIAAAEAK